MLTPKCPKHDDKNCEVYCEECDIPVCITCISSGKHNGHSLADLLDKINLKQQGARKGIEELESKICPQLEAMISNDQTERVRLESHYEKLATVVDQHGEVWHREINAIVKRQKSGIQERKTRHLAAHDKHTDQIKRAIADTKEDIQKLKRVVGSNDISLTSDYKSRIDDFKTFSPKVEVTLPTFCAPAINTEKLKEMFGSLSTISTAAATQMLDEPLLTATIDTGYKDLYGAACLSDGEVWTCGDKIMKLINFQNEVLKTIQTKSGINQRDIAVTREGNLAYTDMETRTINIMKRKQLPTVIKLDGWIPFNICSTSSGDLLATMVSDDNTKSRVVRYIGSIGSKTQIIQYDDQGQPLYSIAGHVSENRNLDVCVADRKAGALIVVNQAGKLRFRYVGHPSNTKSSFSPFGITTDSQSRILTADHSNDCVHILDQDGQFICYIDNCHVQRPIGLCVDAKGYLILTEWYTSKVKKIQYQTILC
jgi:tripartite motif-containing protein 2/3